MVTAGAAGSGLIVTAMAVLGPSQPVVVWLTYQVVVPVVVVAGVGAVAVPVPPVAVVYHSRLLPVAVSGVVVAF